MRKTKASIIALCGIFAALAVAVMFLGGTIPFAVYVAPVLSSLLLVPVYAECGNRWGWVWYLAVSILSILVAPDKESAILFIGLGYYPLIKRYFGRMRLRFLKWILKLIYFDAVVVLAYFIMVSLFHMTGIREDFQEMSIWLLIIFVFLGNVVFLMYDSLIDRLTVFYHSKIRPKIK